MYYVYSNGVLKRPFAFLYKAIAYAIEINYADSVITDDTGEIIRRFENGKPVCCSEAIDYVPDSK